MSFRCPDQRIIWLFHCLDQGVYVVQLSRERSCLAVSLSKSRFSYMTFSENPYPRAVFCFTNPILQMVSYSYFCLVIEILSQFPSEFYAYSWFLAQFLSSTYVPSQSDVLFLVSWTGRQRRYLMTKRLLVVPKSEIRFSIILLLFFFFCLASKERYLAKFSRPLIPTLACYLPQHFNVRRNFTQVLFSGSRHYFFSPRAGFYVQHFCSSTFNPM